MEKFLLTRKEAAERYGMSVRGLEEFYKSHPEFPIRRLGPHKVMIVMELADEFFINYAPEGE